MGRYNNLVGAVLVDLLSDILTTASIENEF